MNVDKTCRLCASVRSRMKSILRDYEECKLRELITDVLRIQICPDEGLPTSICKACANTLLKMKENIECFQENDRRLRRTFLRPSVGEYHRGVESTSKKMQVEPVESVESLVLEAKTQEVRLSIPTEENATTIGDTTSDEENSYEVDKSRSKPDCTLTKSDTTPRRRHRQDLNRPKLNDHKCYICKSGSMGSAKALLEHLSVHLELMPYKCTDCVMEPIVLKNVRSLNVHKKMHAQPIKCEYCDRRYSDAWARDGHVKSYHLGESAPCPSSCEKCGKICRSLSALKSHMRDHKLDVRCHLCDKLFHRYSKLRDHVTRVHEKADKYECNICKHVVHSLESYNSHLKMHNAEKTYGCDLCPMKFYTAGNLGLHKKVHAKNVNYKPHKDWTSHYKVSHDPDREKVYTCNHCSNVYSGSINTIISHVKHHFKELKCDQCELKFTNKHKLKVHYVVHTRERNYRCEYCEKDFLYRTHMTHHIKHKHRVIQERSTEEIDNGNVVDAMAMAGYTLMKT